MLLVYNTNNQDVGKIADKTFNNKLESQYEEKNYKDNKHVIIKEVRNIGAMFDPQLNMSTQVKKLCRGAWINLHNIGKIRSYLTEDQTKTTVHAYVTSKLDGNNALLAGTPSVLIKQIQRVQNSAVKLVNKI